ncbi:DNA-directed RNA polymerase I 16 kD polypeptide, putative [Pediculus humanus corporis]|uniref:DNA-directed RNA polymerases I and III subunit RPAC2 n=1 Tax=Pediculus humanus subsp. corporis TaxID=121224 RepID=E0W436_PEDHC|nr:DNA-directed RNA polymerase I 16 kD polypeptide, putative [Pediculus humanus corporis]EEB20392.1 DNA-directed RNA polymerase I 16 kD polypeptide, putative [Pediculus humanus corporis]
MGIAELVGDNPSDESSRTFVFDGEGHTLGNALRSVISRYSEVTFCGYTIPHPSEEKINFRIQTSGARAVDILKKGLTDLEEHCEYIMNVFSQEVENYKAIHDS